MRPLRQLKEWPNTEEIIAYGMAMEIRGIRDNVRTYVQNEIQGTNRRGVLPPSRERKAQKVVVLCDGMPSIPRKQPLSEFLAAKGFWVIYPPYRGPGEG